MRTDPDIRFHLKALAASGDKHAINIVKGLELLNWPILDSRHRRVNAPIVETILIDRPSDDVIIRLDRLGWAMVTGHEVLNLFSYFRYKHDFWIPACLTT